MSAVFSRVRGSSGFSLLLAFLRFGRGGWGGWLLGVFSGSGLGAPGSCSLWGVGVGCAWRVRLLRFCAGVGCVCAWFLTSLCFGGWGWVCLCVWFILGMRFPGVGRAARLLCFVRGLGVPGFLFRVRGGFGRVRGGFPGVFVSARRFLPLVWGVSGWVGVVFSPAVLLGPGLFRVWVWFCLESLILAQDERWRRA